MAAPLRGVGIASTAVQFYMFQWIGTKESLRCHATKLLVSTSVVAYLSSTIDE